MRKRGVVVWGFAFTVQGALRLLASIWEGEVSLETTEIWKGDYSGGVHVEGFQVYLLREDTYYYLGKGTTIRKAMKDAMRTTRSALTSAGCLSATNYLREV